MDDPRERFLGAEEQAHQLLDRLQSLEAEIQRHGTAADSLQEARSALVQVAGELGSAGSEMRSLITKLGELGTAEIVERINTSSMSLAKGILEATASSQEAHKDETEHAEEIKSLLSERASELSSTQVSIQGAITKSAEAQERRILIALGIGLFNLVGLAVLVVLILSRS